MYKGFEIRQKQGIDNYDTILYPKTKMSNVMYSKNTTAEEKIIYLYNIIKNSSSTSISNYTCNTANQNVITINNDNYLYLDSSLEVILNGLLLIQDYHYEIVQPNSIRLLSHNLNVGDEIIFKVSNSLKVNLDIDYETMPTDKATQLQNIINSINEYANLVNSGKKKIADELKRGQIQIEWNNSFDDMANEIKKLIDSKKGIPSDLGLLFATPYFGMDFGLNLGNLFGTQIVTNGFISNLGGLF